MKYPILPGTAGSGEVTDILSANPKKGNLFRDKLYYNQRSANSYFFFIKGISQIRQSAKPEASCIISQSKSL
jgi:hypothetical protein